MSYCCAVINRENRASHNQYMLNCERERNKDGKLGLAMACDKHFARFLTD